MQRRARRSLNAQTRHKEFLRIKGRREQGVRKQALTIRNEFAHTPKALFPITAPERLQFIRNPEAVCKFIANLQKCFDDEKPVYVELRKVKEIDDDAIIVLLSVMVRFKSQRIRFNGDHPRDKGARAIIRGSGFFDHLYKGFSEEESYSLSGKSSIVTHAMRVVDAALGAKIIESASEVVWGEKKRCTGVQRTLIELMMNTNNHASLEVVGEKHWWLSVKHIKEQNRVAFSFVDYGVGIFTSLQNKTASSKFFGALQAIYQRLFGTNNAKALEMIFRGELHRTATGKTYRGKGLPGIYQAWEDKKISNLALITNNVFFDSRTDTYKILNTPFEGTFVYWELCLENTNLPYVAP